MEDYQKKSEELLPCPFCDGTAKIHYLEKEHPYVYRVQCSKCFALSGTNFSYSELNSAVKNWNTRGGVVWIK